MKKEIVLFSIAVLIGLGWADHQIHDLREGRGEIKVYGWQIGQDAVSGIWLGKIYPLLVRDPSGRMIIQAGGLDYPVMNVGQDALKIAAQGYEKASAKWRSISAVLSELWDR